MHITLRSKIRVRLFVKVHRLDRWIKDRFTPMGRALLGSLVAVGLFSLNPRLTQAWLLAIVLLTVILVAVIQAPWFRPALRIRRQLPAYATVGHPLLYSITLENRSKWDLPSVQVLEKAPRLRFRDLLQSTAGPGGVAIFKFASGYPQFVRLIRLRDGFRAERSECDGLGEGDARRLSLRIAPLRRGYLQLSRLCLERIDPLGVFRAWYEIPGSDQVLVLPRRYPLLWRDDSGRNRRQGSGRAQSSATGGSVDFARLREYRQGDPIRHIHWRAWAHLGTPVVMEFHQQTPGRSALILDTFPCAITDATVEASHFEEAVSVAASFCGDTHWCNGRLELLLLGEQTVHLGSGPQGSNLGFGVDAMLEALACVQPAPGQSPERLVHLARRELAGVEQCICVLCDFDESRQALLRDLQVQNISVLVLVVHAQAQARIDQALMDQSGELKIMPQQVVAIVPGQAAQVLAQLPTVQRLGIASGHG